MRVRFTSPAAEDYAEAADFLIEKNPVAARSFLVAIDTVLNDLLLFPHSGRMTEKEGVRVRTLTGFPYRIYYELDGDTIVILSVFHTSRNPEDSPAS